MVANFLIRDVLFYEAYFEALRLTNHCLKSTNADVNLKKPEQPRSVNSEVDKEFLEPNKLRKSKIQISISQKV